LLITPANLRQAKEPLLGRGSGIEKCVRHGRHGQGPVWGTETSERRLQARPSGDRHARFRPLGNWGLLFRAPKSETWGPTQNRLKCSDAARLRMPIVVNDTIASRFERIDGKNGIGLTNE